MIVYLTHPQHGTHIAYSNDEVEKCKLAGWKVREEPKKPEPLLPPRLPKLSTLKPKGSP